MTAGRLALVLALLWIAVVIPWPTLVAEAQRLDEEVESALRELMAEDPGIGDVRGPGLMIGVEFVTDRGSRVPDGGRADQATEEDTMRITRALWNSF